MRPLDSMSGLVRTIGERAHQAAEAGQKATERPVRTPHY